MPTTCQALEKERKKMSKTCPYPCPLRAASTGRDGVWIDQHTNQQLQSDNQYEGRFQGCIRAHREVTAGRLRLRPQEDFPEQRVHHS